MQQLSPHAVVCSLPTHLDITGEIQKRAQVEKLVGQHKGSFISKAVFASKAMTNVFITSPRRADVQRLPGKQGLRMSHGYRGR